METTTCTTCQRDRQDTQPIYIARRVPENCRQKFKKELSSISVNSHHYYYLSLWWHLTAPEDCGIRVEGTGSCQRAQIPASPATFSSWNQKGVRNLWTFGRVFYMHAASENFETTTENSENYARHSHEIKKIYDYFLFP